MPFYLNAMRIPIAQRQKLKRVHFLYNDGSTPHRKPGKYPFLIKLSLDFTPASASRLTRCTALGEVT